MTKYAHVASKKITTSGNYTYIATAPIGTSQATNNFLLESTQPGQRIIKTSMGDFKIRKNGRRILVIDLGKENEEILRVTPVETVEVGTIGTDERTSVWEKTVDKNKRF